MAVLRLLIAFFALAAWPAAAQTIVVSSGPADVAVTLYRASYRGYDNAIDPDSLNGYALVTERRTVRLPKGRALVRFEGVAGNIFAESVIVRGLPQGVREKNLDADLLSPRSLYDRMLGRRVIVRRTDKATGKVREEQAIIRSSADGAAVLRFAHGNEALWCGGLPEMIVYPEVPKTLSARPTLSILVDSPRAATAMLTLSYLAGGFDWQADYIVTLRRDGSGADLFGWVTLASSDVTSFAGAETAVVAGKPNREGNQPEFGRYDARALTLKCYPTGARYGKAIPPQEMSQALAPPPPPPPPPPVMMPAPAADIVVTGSKMARQEQLGDYKLYRFPSRVTVASKAQKQVAMLAQPSVLLTTTYVSEIWDGDEQRSYVALRAPNTRAAGLGLPLPAGKVAVFEPAGARPILLGESATDDKAIGEDIEYKLDRGPGVHSAVVAEESSDKATDRYRLTVTNANPWPIAYEAKLAVDADQYRLDAAARLLPVDGRKVWRTTVPANGSATLRYGLIDIDP